MEEVITEIDFIAPCPVEQCKGRNKSYRWIHNSCKGRLKLNKEGMLRCLNCGTQGPFADWPFNCGDHDNKECSALGTSHSFAVLAQINRSTNQQHFIAQTVSKIMQYFIDILTHF